MRALLVVSEDTEFASTIRSGLWNRMETFAARDGAQAAALIGQGIQPDVILLDTSARSVPRWIHFVRQGLHCNPRCPPLLFVRPETILAAPEWARLEATIESMARRGPRQAPLR
ncbi:MAG: hypothetical protein ABI682_14860 [Acidobacteriota bacterium]